MAESEPLKSPEWTPAWQTRWDTICQRLATLATEHGGTATRNGNRLIMHSPGDGPCIHITRGFEPPYAAVRAFDYHDEVKLAMTDDDPDHELEHVVQAIMSGNVEVSASDRGFKVEWPDGGLRGPGFSGSWRLPAWEPTE